MKYFKEFLKRGMVFGGFGPIIAGGVYYVISLSGTEIALSGGQIFTAIVSTYLLAFFQAGASVFNQIERWPVAKSLACHFATVFFAYVACYLVNSWIPFEPIAVAVFAGIFIVAYFVIWLTVYFMIKRIGNKLNGAVD